jgi:hypothetical protein
MTYHTFLKWAVGFHILKSFFNYRVILLMVVKAVQRIGT